MKERRNGIYQTIGYILLFATMIAGVETAAPSKAYGQHDGLLTKDGNRLFPIGFYELPKEDAKLKAMAISGVNLVRCKKRADLDRAGAVGMMGVITLPLQNGAAEQLRDSVNSVKDHPALVVWEGPDEIIWNFTASSQLHRTRGIHKEPGEWWKQTPLAVEYAEKQARTIIPNMRAAVQLIRSLDKRDRPIWINEALESDLMYVRRYLDFVDVTGCDIYPVKKHDRRIFRMGSATERWKQVGRGKPVWMVLQAFAWSELGEYYGVKELAYPTFAESRFMAYDVIAHGADGILYWGSHYLKSVEFRESIYALTSELSALQAFLTAPEEKGVRVNLIEFEEEGDNRGVKTTVRKSGDDWLIVLVNEDDQRHMGIEVTGLQALNGQRLELLYGTESVQVRNGELIARMQPFEVKVFASNRNYETSRRNGRDFMTQ